MRSVTRDTLTFDNICCANTIIMFILCKTFYPKYRTILENVYEMDGGRSLYNYLDILPYWDKYYSSRTRELFRLEFSTGLKPNDLFNMRWELEDAIRELLSKFNNSDKFIKFIKDDIMEIPPSLGRS